MLRASPLWLLCAGCPYIFTAPDLSRVRRPEPDPTGATGDTAPALPTADTGPVVLLGPTVTGIRTTPLYEGVDLQVDYDPPGALASGGTLVIVVDGNTTHELGIPGDATLVGETTVRWRLPLPDTCDGIEHTIAATLRDPLGNPGVEGVVELALPGLGVVPGVEGEVTVLGELTPPFLFCFASDGNGDVDALQFVAGAGGDVLIVHSFEEGQTDLDFSLFEDLTPRGGTSGVAPNPEFLPAVLTQGLTYELRVRYYQGAPPVDYQLAVVPQEVEPTTPSSTGDTGGP